VRPPGTCRFYDRPLRGSHQI